MRRALTRVARPTNCLTRGERVERVGVLQCSSQRVWLTSLTLTHRTDLHKRLGYSTHTQFINFTSVTDKRGGEVSVETEMTPNPKSRKYVPRDLNGWAVSVVPSSLSTSSISITDLSQAVAQSPLAEGLMRAAHNKGNTVHVVQFGRDYITVVLQDNSTKSVDEVWGEMSDDFVTIIKRHFAQSVARPLESPTPSSLHLPHFTQELITSLLSKTEGVSAETVPSDNTAGESDSVKSEKKGEDVPDSVERQIEDMIEFRVRPFINRDGGDIRLVRFIETEGIVYVHMSGACDGCPQASVSTVRGISTMLQHYFDEVKEVRLCDAEGNEIET